jgi:hypothetical protein
MKKKSRLQIHSPLSRVAFSKGWNVGWTESLKRLIQVPLGVENGDMGF